MLLLRPAVESGSAVIMTHKLLTLSMKGLLLLPSQLILGQSYSIESGKSQLRSLKKRRSRTTMSKMLRLKLLPSLKKEAMERILGGEKIEEFREVIPEVVVPHWSLRVDELAKLLA